LAARRKEGVLAQEEKEVGWMWRERNEGFPILVNCSKEFRREFQKGKSEFLGRKMRGTQGDSKGFSGVLEMEFPKGKFKGKLGKFQMGI
jgi:hypothetical protein